MEGIFNRYMRRVSTTALLIVATLHAQAVQHNRHERVESASGTQRTEHAYIGQSFAKTLGHNASRFLWGASTSAHQNEGMYCTPESCAYTRMVDRLNEQRSADQKIPTPGDYMCDMRKHYKAYIDQAADAGLNALRFSVEWAQVQPNGPDAWCTQALDHYADIFVYMLKRGITPVVVFHHYTDPCWFEDAGGFEITRNTQYFGAYCAHVYRHIMQATYNDRDACKALEHIKPRHPLWATFNSPEGYAFKRYYTGDAPPTVYDSKKKSLRTTMNVLGNMMDAHVHVYQRITLQHRYLLDAFPDLASPQIGLLKNIHQLDPAPHQSLIQRLTSNVICTMGNSMQHGTLFRFFTSGIYCVPHLGILKRNAQAPHSLDFIGINYYSNRCMVGSNKANEQDERYKTDNPNYRIYPHGVTRAIVEVWSDLAKHIKKNGHAIPIYVTENGIATMDHEKRSRFYCDYIDAIHAGHRAIAREGGMVLGYLPWTLCSNYEWPKLKGESSHREYGLFDIDTKDPSHLILKDGAKSYMAIIDGFVGQSA